MAHYVAELIIAAKIAEPDKRADAEERCASAILELWAQRASFPRTARPFEDLKPVVETLRALNPDQPYPFFWTQMWRRLEDEGDGLPEKVYTWLKVAAGVDHTARMLIEEAIIRAVAVAAKGSKKWADLAASASGYLEKDVELFIRLVSLDDAKPRPEEEERKRLLDRRDRLQAFLSLASDLQSGLDERLKALEGTDGADPE